MPERSTTQKLLFVAEQNGFLFEENYKYLIKSIASITTGFIKKGKKTLNTSLLALSPPCI